MLRNFFLTVRQGFSCPLAAGSGIVATPEGIADANVTAAGVAVLGVLSTSNPQSEDCLSLNVWTKPQVGETKKAVLVWIYGGGFTSGATAIPAYNGDNIVEQEDVVVVSIKYAIFSRKWVKIQRETNI